MKLIYLFSLGLFSGLEARITCLEHRMIKMSEFVSGRNQCCNEVCAMQNIVEI